MAELAFILGQGGEDAAARANPMVGICNVFLRHIRMILPKL